MSKPVALITGASRGIGRGIALELARTHALVATYRGRLDAAETLRAETGAEIIQADIGSAADRVRLLAFTREKFGRLDLLVNNAGMAPRVRQDILAATEESFDELINTNLKGPHFLTQAAANWMAEQGAGRIVFITSLSAYAASPGSSAGASGASERRRCACPGCPNCAACMCDACKSVVYCSRACQKQHWPVHKAACKLKRPGINK